MDQSPISMSSADVFLHNLNKARSSAMRAINSPESPLQHSTASASLSPINFAMQLEDGRHCFTPTAVTHQNAALLSPQANLTAKSRIQQGRHSTSAHFARPSVFFRQQISFCLDNSEGGLIRKSFIPNWTELNPDNWGKAETQVFRDCNRLVRSARHSSYNTRSTTSLSELLTAGDSPVDRLAQARKPCSKRVTVADAIFMIAENQDEEEAFAQGMDARKALRETVHDVEVMKELLDVEISQTSSQGLRKSILRQPSEGLPSECLATEDRKSDRTELVKNTKRNASAVSLSRKVTVSECVSEEIPQKSLRDPRATLPAVASELPARSTARSERITQARADRLKSMTVSMDLNGFVPCETVPTAESLSQMKIRRMPQTVV